MQNNNMILIWDSPELNHDDCEYKILWQSYTVVDPEKEVSIPQLVEGNADELRSKYLSFVYELGEIKVGNKRIIDHLEIRPEFSFWWMTLLVEKCNYAKSPQINSIIKLMALEEWLVDKNFTKIKIATKNQELANAVNQLTGKLGVLFEREKILSKKVTESLVRRVYNTLPDIFKVPVFFVYYLINRWKLKGVGVEKWKNATAKITFVSYFFNLDVDSVNEGVFKDRYWTKLPDLLDKNNIKSSWLHLYVKSDFLPTSTSAKQLIEKFNESHNNTQHHVFLDSFLSLKVVGWTVINWIMLLFKHGRIKSNIEQQANYLWPLIKSDLKVSLVGVAAIQNLLFYHLFRSAMQALPTQRKGFYLQENQGWEFGFVGSWREFVHGQLIGVPHSTVRYWDLRYFFDSKSYGKNGNFDLPLPNKVAVNGEVAKNQYINGGYAEESLAKVEALRYLQLEKSDKDNLLGQKVNDVLVLGDYLQKYTIQQMEMLQESCKMINANIHFIVKPHAMCPIHSQDYKEINMTVTGKSIDKLIDQCTIVYTSSVTSAAVDAYCAGKKVVTVLDETTLNLSPLRGCNGVSFVSSPDELADIINRIDRVEIDKDQGNGYFYLDKDLPRWRELLLDSDIERKTDSEVVQ